MTIDDEIQALLFLMEREGSAALDCDEYEAGAHSMRKRQKQLYELMCRKFGPDWLTK